MILPYVPARANTGDGASLIGQVTDRLLRSDPSGSTRARAMTTTEEPRGSAYNPMALRGEVICARGSRHSEPGCGSSRRRARLLWASPAARARGRPHDQTQPRHDWRARCQNLQTLIGRLIDSRPIIGYCRFSSNNRVTPSWPVHGCMLGPSWLHVVSPKREMYWRDEDVT